MRVYSKPIFWMDIFLLLLLILLLFSNYQHMGRLDRLEQDVKELQLKANDTTDYLNTFASRHNGLVDVVRAVERQ